MEQKENGNLVIRLHQFVILVLLVFSLFVKPEVKKVFWLIIGTAVISLLIQVILFGVKPDSFGNKINNHPHEG